MSLVIDDIVPGTIRGTIISSHLSFAWEGLGDRPLTCALIGILAASNRP
jgi:hypothetical protein